MTRRVVIKDENLAAPSRYRPLFTDNKKNSKDIQTLTDYTHFQTGSDLMKTALDGIAPRTPVYAQLHEFVARQMNIPAPVFYTRPDIMVPAMLEVQTQYRLDTASLTYDIYNIEAEALGQKLRFSDANMPDIDRSQPLIRSAADLNFVKTPDFDNAGRCSQVIEMFTLYHKLTGLQPTLGFCAPFSLAANLMGIEQLIMAILTEPDFARRLLERLTEEVLAPWILYQKAHFPQATKVSGADAIASLPVVNLRMLKQWAVPYILRLRELCGPEVQVVNWVGERCLKKPAEMLELKLSVGPTCIQGQDPDVEALGPALYKEFAVSHNVPLTLGVGASFLDQNSPEKVAERVHSYIQTGAAGGRFALYLCNIGASTPPENLRAAIEAARN